VRSLEELTRTFPDEWFENIEPQLLQLHDNDRVGDALALIAPWAVKLRWITFGEVDDEPLPNSFLPIVLCRKAETLACLGR